MMQEKTPLVSIIMAAYNRSNVLKFAIESVIRSTVTDWELLVIGDACTDDSEEVAASFKDSRIIYKNLNKNTGNQSGPNNEGFSIARGRYIAYLSQDDLWFPDHLERALRKLNETNADWVFSTGIIYKSDGEVNLHGVVPNGCFHARYGVEIVASLWVLKKEVLNEIGGWRDYRDILIPPSQDLLIRGWRAGKKILMVPAATAIILPSAWRKGSYSNRDYEENKELFSRMCSDPYFREKQLLNISIFHETEIAKSRLDLKRGFKKLAAILLRRLGLLFGVMPVYLFCFIRYKKKGGFIKACRKARGLDN